MSSKPSRVLKFNRVLSDVRIPSAVAPPVAGGKGAKPAAARAEPPAEAQAELQGRTEHLARKEADLAREESELARQKAEFARREREFAQREAALAEKSKQLDDQLARLGNLYLSAEREKTQMLEATEDSIVAFGLSITKKVLQYEVENGRYKIGEIVKGALEAVRSRGQVVVRVNPHDFDVAAAAVEKLSQTPEGRRISCMPDDSIPPAACCIETDSGRIFSDVSERLERIEENLLKKKAETNGV